jgi:hypothetical protein
MYATARMTVVTVTTGATATARLAPPRNPVSRVRYPLPKMTSFSDHRQTIPHLHRPHTKIWMSPSRNLMRRFVRRRPYSTDCAYQQPCVFFLRLVPVWVFD